MELGIEEIGYLRGMADGELKFALAGLEPVAVDERVGEKIGLTGHLTRGAELEAGGFGQEECPDLVMTDEVMTAHVDVGAVVPEVVIAEQQGDIVGMCVLEVQNLLKVMKGVIGCDALVAVGVEVVAEEDDVLVLATLNGSLPEGSAVNVWDDYHI